MAKEGDESENVDEELPKETKSKSERLNYRRSQSNMSIGDGGNRPAGSLRRRRTSLGDNENHDGEKKRKDPEYKSTFVDAAAMKEKVRQQLTRPQVSVRDYYKETGMWQCIAKSTAFEYASLGIVAFNALWISIDTDLNDAELLLKAHPVFQVAEHMFCFVFTVELLVRFMAFKYKRNIVKDPWFLFDSFMVTMMVLETWVMTFVLLIVGTGGGGAGNASILRIARLMRLSRMARMARLLRALPELMIMIRGMMAATRSVFFTLCLLVIVLYVFAIAFTQMTESTECGNKYFKTVPESMFTLLVYGTLLDNVGSIAKDLGKEQMMVAALFFLFVLIAALTVMNMLIGVLCEVVNAVAATEKEEMLVTYVNQKLQRVVSLLDTDGGGTISKKEFMQILENTDAVRCLQDVGVDVVGLVDFADFIFESEDMEDQEDDNELELDFSQFMEVVLQLRGTNNATVKDVVDLRKFLRNSITSINHQVARIQQNCEFTRSAVGQLSSSKLLDAIHSLEHMMHVHDPHVMQYLQPDAKNHHHTKNSKYQKPDRDHRVESAVDGARLPTTRDIKREKIADGIDNNIGTVINMVTLPPDTHREVRPSPGHFQPPATYIVEAGGTPVPLQPSPSVHLLRPEGEDSFSGSGPWSNYNPAESGFTPPALQGQWYPVEPVEVQLRSMKKPEVVLDRRSPELSSIAVLDGRSPELSSITADRLVAGALKNVEYRPMEATVRGGQTSR